MFSSTNLISQGYSKYPVSRPSQGRDIKVRINDIDKIGVAGNSRECGGVMIVNGKTYDSNHTLFWKYIEVMSDVNGNNLNDGDLVEHVNIPNEIRLIQKVGTDKLFEIEASRHPDSLMVRRNNSNDVYLLTPERAKKLKKVNHKK